MEIFPENFSQKHKIINLRQMSNMSNSLCFAVYFLLLIFFWCVVQTSLKCKVMLFWKFQGEWKTSRPNLLAAETRFLSKNFLSSVWKVSVNQTDDALSDELFSQLFVAFVWKVTELAVWKMKKETWEGGSNSSFSQSHQLGSNQCGKLNIWRQSSD